MSGGLNDLITVEIACQAKWMACFMMVHGSLGSRSICFPLLDFSLFAIPATTTKSSDGEKKRLTHTKPRKKKKNEKSPAVRVF